MIVLWAVLLLAALFIVGALGWLSDEDVGCWAGVVVGLAVVALLAKWVMG